MSKVIAFSGGCNAGKTTTMYLVKEALEHKGLNVKILGERIRTCNKSNLSIDELRKDPLAYLALQEEASRQKMKDELEAFLDKSDTIYLEDRAISDSIFYLLAYLDKANLPEEALKRYYKLYKDLMLHALTNSFARYYEVITFIPLYKIAEDVKNDKYRPAMLEYLAPIEGSAIRSLTEGLIEQVWQLNEGEQWNAPIRVYINYHYTETEQALNEIISSIKL